MFSLLLQIVMEYCGGGSVSDIMRHRKQTLTEPQMAPILRDTLLGLEYLHSRSKIHRDVKAGNILLNIEGHAKLADFGVAGQLTDTMAKRNTVIGQLPNAARRHTAGVQAHHFGWHQK
jgi:serine/threonine protein kinase